MPRRGGRHLVPPSGPRFTIRYLLLMWGVLFAATIGAILGAQSYIDQLRLLPPGH